MLYCIVLYCIVLYCIVLYCIVLYCIVLYYLILSINSLSLQARRNILSIHTNAWQPKLTQSFINEVADHCVGYCGADVKALCTEATLFALRRRYPQIYASKKKLVLDVESVRITGRDFARAIKTIVPACQRAVVSPGRALSSSIRPLLQDILTRCWTMMTKIFPPSVCRTGSLFNK